MNYKLLGIDCTCVCWGAEGCQGCEGGVQVLCIFTQKFGREGGQSHFVPLLFDQPSVSIKHNSAPER